MPTAESGLPIGLMSTSFIWLLMVPHEPLSVDSGTNGIVLSPDQKMLVVTDNNTPGLYAFSMGENDKSALIQPKLVRSTDSLVLFRQHRSLNSSDRSEPAGDAGLLLLMWYRGPDSNRHGFHPNGF